MINKLFSHSLESIIICSINQLVNDSIIQLGVMNELLIRAVNDLWMISWAKAVNDWLSELLTNRLNDGLSEKS